jgi:hypothetical protein
MDQKKFLKRILPANGSYFVARIKNKRLTQVMCETLDDALQQITKFAKARYNVFIATGSFAQTRRIENCTGKQILYADIDCKPVGGQYISKAEAAKGIRGAIQRGIPEPSAIIDSGGGLHLYWVLATTMLPTEWNELAKAFEYACAECKLNIDKGISTDAARILRVPGTVNYKDTANPKPCKILYDSGPDYEVSEFTASIMRFTKDSSISLNSEMSAGVNDSGFREGSEPAFAEPPPAAGMLENCPVFSGNLERGGEGTAEVLWHKIIHTLAYTSDGEDYIHSISNKHVDYAPHIVNAKWGWANRQKARPGLGPSKCATFEESGAEECATCPLRGKGKSPISLAYRNQPTPEGELPFPYRNAPSGVEKYEKAAIEMHEIQNPQAAASALSRFGLHLRRHHVEHLNGVVHSFMQDLQRAGKLQPPIQNYGWLKGGGFHAGGSVYGVPDYSGNIKIDVNIADAYEPCGELAIWQECAGHILSQPRPACWVVLATAFGAPLMTFTGAEGALIACVSTASGTGKSTAVKVSQAVWGHPKNGVAHLNDTPNSVVNRLGILSNLPAYWDEIRGEQEVDGFVKFIFRLSQGKDKQRLTSDIKQRKAGQWATVMVVASNEPVREHIARTVGNSDAGAARVFEIYANPIKDPSFSDGGARAFYHRCETNFGRAGEIYAKFLGENKEMVKKRVLEYDDKLCRAFNTTGDERYWVATIATLLVGAIFANHLKITKFDISELQKYLFEQFKLMRSYKKAEFATGKANAADVLKQYLLLKTDFACWADRIPVRGMKKSAYQVKIASEKNPTIIRYATEDKVVRLATQQFKEWIYATRGVGAEEIIQDLVRMGGKLDQARIDTGAKANGARLRVIDIPFTGEFSDLDASDTAPDVINGDLGA